MIKKYMVSHAPTILPIKYGYLYNFPVVSDSRNVAPVGWHVPSDAEFGTLISFLGGSGLTTINKLQTVGWGSGSNSSGFDALPAGRGFGGGISFDSIGTDTWWWTTTPGPDGYKFYLRISTTYLQSYNALGGGISIRCIKDNNTPTVGGITYDIDGNSYTEVVIGTQIWMAQNLATTKYRNGDSINKFRTG